MSYPEFLSHLRAKVRDNYSKNPSIHYIKSSEDMIPDSGIDFNVKILESLKKKPEGNPNALISYENKRDDPFMPPYEEGQYIEDIFDNYCLLYNKYSVCE